MLKIIIRSKNDDGIKELKYINSLKLKMLLITAGKPFSVIKISKDETHIVYNKEFMNELYNNIIEKKGKNYLIKNHLEREFRHFGITNKNCEISIGE